MTTISNVKVYDLEESVIAARNAMRLTPPEYTEEEFNKLRCGAEAVIRNPAFARLLNVPMCKKFIQMKTGDAALVVGTDGGKLNYHANSLPEGISLKYTKVEILGATV